MWSLSSRKWAAQYCTVNLQLTNYKFSLPVGVTVYRKREVEDAVEQRGVAHGAERAADAVLLLVQVGGAVQLQEAVERGRVRLRQHRAVARRPQVRRQRARARYVLLETVQRFLNY